MKILAKILAKIFSRILGDPQRFDKDPKGSQKDPFKDLQKIFVRVLKDNARIFKGSFKDLYKDL